MKKSAQNVRLSRDVIPHRYEIKLKPDLEAFVFEGEETIHLTLKKPTTRITLHADELEIESVEVLTDVGMQDAQKISYNKAAETASFDFAQPLPKGTVQLKINFRGILNDKMRGFYRSQFAYRGKTHTIATTQFESTDARKAIPCFDEPEMKAVFEVSLVVPSDKTAISNTLPIDIAEHGGGYKVFTFSPTPAMSTYLLAFIVGDFEYIEKRSADGILVRVFTTPGKKEQARFALDCAAKTVTYFNKYFGIRYPLPVLDMIAIPDFAAGAMENWGAITYRESALLVDPANSSTMNKQWVALVIAHEIAHQWFGNLVTMQWWTHLWLNEGFASYIEYLAVDKIFPSWDMWTQFINHDMRPAFHLDALKHTHPIEVEVHHPSEIAAVFDAVSYSKGATIIRMLAEYLGEKNFRDGLRYYLKKHQHGNTVTEDLWRALAHVSGKPVEKIMANWTGKGGYPLVAVSEKGGTLALSQSRFFSSPLSAKQNKEKTIWQVPIAIATDKGRQKEPYLLTKQSASITKPRGSWVKLNADETAFFRTVYAPALRDQLGKAAAARKLKVRDRLGLIRDVFALAENGRIDASEALEFAANFKKETEYVVWAELASSLANIHSLIAHEKFLAQFESFALDLFSDIRKKYDWDTKTSSHAGALLKVLVLGSLGKYGDQKTIATAQNMLTKAATGKNTIAPDLRGVVYSIAARYGGSREYKMLLDLYAKAEMHEEKNRLGNSLGNFRNKALLEKTLHFALSDTVRLQDKTRMIAYVTMNPMGLEISWPWIQRNWKTFTERYSGTRDLLHLIDPMHVSSSKILAGELKAFFKKHKVAGMQRTLDQTLEQIAANALWLQRNKKSVAEFLVR